MLRWLDGLYKIMRLFWISSKGKTSKLNIFCEAPHRVKFDVCLAYHTMKVSLQSGVATIVMVRSADSRIDDAEIHQLRKNFRGMAVRFEGPPDHH